MSFKDSLALKLLNILNCNKSYKKYFSYFHTSGDSVREEDPSTEEILKALIWSQLPNHIYSRFKPK